MMEIIENKARLGCFTSSTIADLLTVSRDKKSFGAPALALIKDKQMEIRLGRSLNADISARPTTWGKLVEKRVFDILGLEYTGMFNETFIHPTIPHWSGTPDAIKNDEGGTVVDIKSPYTLKSFCTLADCKDIHEVRMAHKEGDKYFYQLVSNAILTGSRFAELIIYCPYKSELAAIKELAQNWDGEDQNDYAWINWAQENKLPYLIEGNHYKNLNIFRFEVPQSEIDLLTEKVVAAVALLRTS